MRGSAGGRRSANVAAAGAAAALLWCAGALQAQEPYAGSEACGICHEDIAAAFRNNAHHVVDLGKRRGWEKDRACESCHGPGARHAESADAAAIRNPAKLKPAEADRTCLGCHLHQPTQVGRLSGGHARNQVSCFTCHPVHRNGGENMAPSRAARINAQCAGCHTAAWAEFQRPFRHRLPEEAMSCVDCHNPHGSFVPRSMQTVSANQPGCLKCHGDKRGPFTFEHAPVRLEGCSSCHQPHGSANPRMLTRQDVRLVCLECHANLGAGGTQAAALGGVPPAFHDLRNPRFRNCTLCHLKIHGSYVDRALLR